MKHFRHYKDCLEEANLPYSTAELFSRNLITEMLKWISDFTSIEQTTDQYDVVDLLATSKNNTKIGIEIKNRSKELTSDRYGDHLIEKSKFAKIYKRINNKDFDIAWLCSVYQDGVIAVTTNILNKVKAKEVRNCPDETAKGNEIKYVEKECCIYNQDIKVYFCLYYEDNETMYHPYFSLQPINVEYLNHAENLPKSVDLLSL